jgi:hypothetical protein
VIANWVEFDGYCSARGMDAITLSPDRAVNLYRHALYEHADEKDRQKIDEALTPPKTLKIGGAPAWYGSDDEAWAQFMRQAPKRQGVDSHRGAHR